MNLISDFRRDDSGAVFGMWLFIVLVATATISLFIVMPMVDAMSAGFDDDYRDTYLSAEGKQTVNTLEFILRNVLVLFVVIVGGVMVINRAILQSRL